MHFFVIVINHHPSKLFCFVFFSLSISLPYQLYLSMIYQELGHICPSSLPSSSPRDKTMAETKKTLTCTSPSSPLSLTPLCKMRPLLLLLLLLLALLLLLLLDPPLLLLLNHNRRNPPHLLPPPPSLPSSPPSKHSTEAFKR